MPYVPLLNAEFSNTPQLYETADALAYLHGAGFVHGDMKGTNILVSDDVHVLLCDFGLTKLASSSTTTSLKSAGSLRWQSPELWEADQSKTYASDTYAFGMTIAEVSYIGPPLRKCLFCAVDSHRAYPIRSV